MKYPIKRKPEVMFDLNLVREYCNDQKKISLIKEYRSITGNGLKDAKDAVERYCKYTSNTGYTVDVEGMVRTFKEHLICEPDPFTKEEFMNLVENCIDNMELMCFLDMLEATQLLLKNVEKNGGLKELARKRDNFLGEI